MRNKTSLDGTSRDQAGVKLHRIGGVAERLDCSTKHVQRLIASGALRAVEIKTPDSRKPMTRVRSDDLDAYMHAQTRSARRLYTA